MLLSPSEQLAHSTVRIETSYLDGSAGTGTGFFFSFRGKESDQTIPAIVTNKHVVAGAPNGKIHLTLRNDENGPRVGKHLAVAIDQFGQGWVPHPDESVDLCVMPINPLLAHCDSLGRRFFFVSLDESLLPTQEELDDLTALEDILMIGYPNGIWDSANNMPILRRGVTATHPKLDYECRKDFVVDAACFPGSSGSPIFLFNTGTWSTRQGTIVGGSRIKLLGFLYAGPQHTASGEVRIINVPTQQRAVAFSTIPNNLGFVIKASRLREMQDALIAHLDRAEAAT
ncbi:S1 family peptidase [Xanthomonas sacchari]